MANPAETSFDLDTVLEHSTAGDGGSPAQRTDPAMAFAELARIDLRTSTLQDVLTLVAELARDTIPGAEEVSVSLLQGEEGATPAFTGPLALESDERQYVSGGPCVDAARTGEPVVVRDTRTEERWPDYIAGAVRAGIRSSLSVPIPSRESLHGAINCYGAEPDQFDDEALHLAQTFAGYAGVAVANAHLYQATAALAEQLEHAMASRAAIEQAKGLIMGQRRCGPDEAFAILSQASQRTNRKLRDIAADVVRAAQKPR